MCFLEFRERSISLKFPQPHKSITQPNRYNWDEIGSIIQRFVLLKVESMLVDVPTCGNLFIRMEKPPDKL